LGLTHISQYKLGGNNMKKIKTLTTVLMIITLMLGSIGFVEAQSDIVEDSTDGGYTTLENPNPVGF